MTIFTILNKSFMGLVKINIAISIICFFVTNIILCQTSDYNNFQRRLSIANDSLEKVYLYHNLVNELKNDSLDLAIYYNQKALKLANKIKSGEACGTTNELMGELFVMNNNIQPAINYYLISAKIYEELNDYDKLSSVYGNLGMLYYNNNYDTERTLYYYQKSLDYAVQLNNKGLIAEAYNRIGSIFFDQNNFDDALYYFTKSVEISKELENTKSVAIGLNNVGDIYRLKGNLSKALNYYKQSVELNTETNNLNLKAINLENMGQISSIQGKTNLAFNYYNSSLSIYKSINNVDGLSELYILMAAEYLNSNDTDGAYNSYRDAYEIAVEYNQWEHIKQSSIGLSNIYQGKKDFKKSLIYLHTYTQYNDSIIKKQMSDELFKLQSHFLRNLKEKEIQIKDSDIEILENEQVISNLRQNIFILAVIVFVILTVSIILRLRFRVKKEKILNQNNKKLHETQQKLLRVELNSKDNDLINFALHLVQKNKILKQLKTDLNKLSGNSDDEMNRKLKDLSIHVQQSLQINKDIEEFQEKVDITYDDYFRKLKIQYPSLTTNEKRLCALLRLNLSTKEIASLNNISIKAVEMSRYRLRKKFNIDNKQSIHEYLNHI